MKKLIPLLLIPFMLQAQTCMDELKECATEMDQCLVITEDLQKENMILHRLVANYKFSLESHKKRLILSDSLVTLHKTNCDILEAAVKDCEKTIKKLDRSVTHNKLMKWVYLGSGVLTTMFIFSIVR